VTPWGPSGEALSIRAAIQHSGGRNIAQPSPASSSTTQSHSADATAVGSPTRPTTGARHRFGALPMGAPVPPLLQPAVLVLTGDPRRGGNVFDVEVATIRRALVIGVTSSEHLAMIEVGEIAAAIDRLRPAVLHISAHHEFAGVVLSHQGEEHLVAASDIADALDRADHRPACALLAFCRSDLVAPQVARTVPVVVSWPSDLSDAQGGCFSGEFYGHLSAHRPVRRAFQEAVSVLASLHPAVTRPLRRSRIEAPVL
jgi:hypothetical protein